MSWRFRWRSCSGGALALVKRADGESKVRYLSGPRSRGATPDARLPVVQWRPPTTARESVAVECRARRRTSTPTAELTFVRLWAGSARQRVGIPAASRVVLADPQVCLGGLQSRLDLRRREARGTLQGARRHAAGAAAHSDHVYNGVLAATFGAPLLAASPRAEDLCEACVCHGRNHRRGAARDRKVTPQVTDPSCSLRARGDIDEAQHDEEGAVIHEEHVGMSRGVARSSLRTSDRPS